MELVCIRTVPMTFFFTSVFYYAIIPITFLIPEFPEDLFRHFACYSIIQFHVIIKEEN